MPEQHLPGIHFSSNFESLQVQCTSTPRASVWEGLGRFQERELTFQARVRSDVPSAATVSAIFTRVHRPQRLVTGAQAKLQVYTTGMKNNSVAFGDTL